MAKTSQMKRYLKGGQGPGRTLEPVKKKKKKKKKKTKKKKKKKKKKEEEEEEEEKKKKHRKDNTKICTIFKRQRTYTYQRKCISDRGVCVCVCVCVCVSSNSSSHIKNYFFFGIYLNVSTC